LYLQLAAAAAAVMGLRLWALPAVAVQARMEQLVPPALPVRATLEVTALEALRAAAAAAVVLYREARMGVLVMGAMVERGNFLRFLALPSFMALAAAEASLAAALSASAGAALEMAR
jgi:hypothetical protein